MKKILESKKSKNTLILIIIACLLLLFLIFVLYPTLTRLIYSRDIPTLPDLSGQSEVLTEYLIEIYNETLDDPVSDAAVGHLAMVFHSNFFYDHAILCYSLAIKLNPNEWRWPYSLALIYEELGDAKATIPYLKNVIQINPRITQAWFRLGNSYLKVNLFDDADYAFNQVLKLKEYYPRHIPNEILLNRGAFPLRAYATLNLSRSAMQKKNWIAAESILIGLIDQYPTFGSAYRLLGQVYQETGNIVKSSKYAIRANDYNSYIPPADPIFDNLMQNSRNTNFMTKQIDIAIKSNNIDWAVFLIRHLFEYNPNDGEFITKLIKLKLDIAYYDGLESLVEIFYGIYSSNADKLTYMAGYFTNRRQNQYTLKLLKQAIAINPNSTEAQYLYIKNLRLTNQLTLAYNHCRQVIKFKPEAANILNEYALILIQQGYPDLARQQLNNTLEIDPKNATTLFISGKLAEDSDNIEEALSYYRSSAQADKQNIIVKLKLINFLLGLHKWDEVLEYLHVCIGISPNSFDLLERQAWLLATCPDNRLRNGEYALELAKRLVLMKKTAHYQIIGSGMALAAAYGELQQYEQAIQIASEYIDQARKINLNQYIPELEELIVFFRAGQPYRLQ